MTRGERRKTAKGPVLVPRIHGVEPLVGWSHHKRTSRGRVRAGGGGPSRGMVRDAGRLPAGRHQYRQPPTTRTPQPPRPDPMT